ncbi:hypothetical protein P3W55_01950 [Pseudomonas citronellolis]|uniref:Uncharacterized protein n=1 Tax=Pseudomonas citronellolis TaxID=53408 RepID=A0AAW6NZT3_9PSED|nr:hypothetical protein [Pseudomonas citronellolis]MDF3840467.1 hypothetical protein [Pseudomonas citronellolis]WRT82960.1 hypothetical protein VK748_00545 [Pseudomonas citronellolis]
MNAQPIYHAPTSPREYAALVLAEPNLERRRDLMARCPEHWRELVSEHVKTGYSRIQSYRAFISGRRQSMAAGPQPAPRREDTSFRISDFKKSAPEKGNQELAKLKALVGGRDGD